MINATILRQLAPSIPLDKANMMATLLDRICQLPVFNIKGLSLYSPGIFHEFLANLLEETGEFSRFSENLDYQSEALAKLFMKSGRITPDQCVLYGRTIHHKANQEAIANTIYGGPWGLKNLGNSQQGDGWRFKGGGEMQLTGRGLYSRFTTFINGQIGTSYTPEQMAQLLPVNRELGIHSACWVFSVVFQLNDEAAADQFSFIVKKLNGGNLNMDKRLHYYELCKKFIV